MANPTITALPEAPQRRMARDTYPVVADKWAAALGPFTSEINLAITWMGQQVTTTAASAKAAADSAAAADQSAGAAGTQAGNAQTYAGQAMGYRDSAQTAAAAAQSAAGMPSISGKADFMLSVNAAGNGVEWRASVPRPTASTVGKVARVNSTGNGYELADGSPLSKYFESSPQTIVSSSRSSVTHGLGGIPKFIQAHLVCTSASAGYSVGDRVEVSTSVGTITENGYDYVCGFAISANSSSIDVLCTSNPPLIPPNPPGTTESRFCRASLNAWKLVLRAAL